MVEPNLYANGLKPNTSSYIVINLLSYSLTLLIGFHLGSAYEL